MNILVYSSTEATKVLSKEKYMYLFYFWIDC